MEVITRYPITIVKTKAQAINDYRGSYHSSEGDIKVLSKGNVIIGGKKINPDDFYMNLTGSSPKAEVLAFQVFAIAKGEALTPDGLWGAKTAAAYSKWGNDWETSKIVAPTTTTTPPTEQKKEEMKKKGLQWDKVRGTWMKVKDTGFLQGMFPNLFGNQNQTGPGPEMPISNTPEAPAPDKKGMSKGMKIGLAVGGVLLLGTVIYFATRKKTAKA